MFGNNRGVDFDVIEDGVAVLRMRYLTQHEPIACCMCGQDTFSTLGVPYYCGPVREGCSEGGYRVACQHCYDRWARWNAVRDLLRPLPASTWRPSHGGYPVVERQEGQA